MKGARSHWLLLRAMSLPLIPLAFYFLTQAEYMTTRSRMEFLAWAGQPVTAAALFVFVVCAFYHAMLGMEEIIIDYIPAKNQKALALLLNKVFFAATGLISLYAVLVIKFGKF